MLADALTDQKPVFQIGLITDIHYADKPTHGKRAYRDSLAKVREAAELFDRREVAFAVELGDLVDAADNVENELAYLKRVQDEFARYRGPRHYVLGNHCVTTLTKKQFLEGVSARQAHYSFDHEPFHFVILDACYRSDGVAYGNKNFKWNDSFLTADQLEWFAADLRQAGKPTVVFVHQRLDVAGDYGVKNAAAVRQLLQDSGKVVAVFQGHNHVNDHKEIEGIHYVTLNAVVDGAGEINNAYSILNVFADGSLKLEGFRTQKSYDWPKK